MTTRLAPPPRRQWLADLGRLGLAGLAAPWAHAAAPGSARVALVIGNAAYEAAPLLNPVRDARAMASLLGQLGFEVLAVHDASQQQLREALARFGERLQARRATAMLYYAGHGVQIDWRNYLLPVDARLRSAADVRAQGLDVQDVIATCRAAGTHTNVLVLDACRDNPFGASGGARGLAPMDAPPGTFFAYATAPGNVADDGSEADGNGLYTRFLLQELRRPQLRIEDVFKRVRLQVRLATQGRQIPWESTSLEDDIVFASGEVLAPPTVAERLRGFDEQRAAWARLSGSSRVEDLVAFVESDPGGPFAELAQFAIDRLAPPLVQAQPPAALAAGLQGVAGAPVAPGADRYRVGDRWAMQWTDHLRGARERRPYEVTRLEGTRVVVNGGRMLMDQMGSIVENELGRRDPGILMVPSELASGRRWRSAYRSEPLSGGVISRVVVDHRVEGLEDIETPAGRFRAWRIAMLGQSVRPADASDLRATLWVDTVSLWPLRAVRRFTAAGRGWLEHHSTEELVAMERVRR